MIAGEAVYLDYAAATPLAAEVIDVMQEVLNSVAGAANASASHVAGRHAAAIVATAREQLAGLLHTTPECIVFTSGATESDNLAIQGAARARAHRGKHLVTMLCEHKAVTDTFRALEKAGFEVTWLRPRADGLLDDNELIAALRADTQLVSVMHVNNETGVIQDIAAIGEICRRHDVLFHTDAAQSAGKLGLDLGHLPVDLLSLSAHKFYGPQGIGALYVANRPNCQVLPLMFGGAQERRLRPGTLPVHLVAGLGRAAEIAAPRLESDYLHVSDLRDQLLTGIRQLDGISDSVAPDVCYPGIVNLSASGVEGESLLLALEPVCVASGSACNSRSGEPSHVLRALGRDDMAIQSAIRFSFGRGTTAEDIDVATDLYAAAVRHLRGIDGTWHAA